MAKSVLVTGASGFLGSHIADELTRRGYDVILYDRIASAYAAGNQQMVVGELSDLEKLRFCCKGVDFVYHCAGIADIGICNNDPRDTVITNILGTVDLLSISCEYKIKRFLFASSAYVFSKMGSFYRSSKKACESYIYDFNKKFGIEYVILRFGSLYGLRSNEKNGMYRLIKTLLNSGDRFAYEGSGDEIREFVHIHDAAKLSVDAIDDRYINSRLLVTGNDRYKMSELIDMIKEIIGKQDIAVSYNDNNTKERYKITPYSYDLEDSLKILNNPYVDIGQGIVQIIRGLTDNE